MQCPSVDGRFVIIMCTSSRSALVVTDCVSLAAAFLAAMLTPSFLLSEKSHAASLLLACKRARDAPTCYQLFSVSGGRVLCIVLSACRRKTLENAVR